VNVGPEKGEDVSRLLLDFKSGGGSVMWGRFEEIKRLRGEQTVGGKGVGAHLLLS